MKKTYNIVIARQQFVIEEDAYDLLAEYLETIKHIFKERSEMEVAEDIEIRTSELLLEKVGDNDNVISYTDIEEVIRRIGRPADMFDDFENVSENVEMIIDNNVSDNERRIDVMEIDSSVSEEAETYISNSVPTPPPPPPVTDVRKRLYRDTSDSLIGGVCAGFAKYLNVDVVWIRLLLVVMIVLSCTTDFFISTFTICFVYLGLWIIIPAAKTPLQRLQMEGKSPTLENISKYFTGDSDNTTDDDNKSKSSVTVTLRNILRVIARIGIILFLILAIPLEAAGIVSILTITIILVAWVIMKFLNPDSYFEILSYGNTDYLEVGYTICGLAALIFLSVLLFAGIYMVLKGKDSSMKRKIWLPLLSLIIVAILIAIAGLIITAYYR